MNKRRVLITGANGMVGRNILEHPAIKGFDVLAPNRSELDLCDLNKVRTYLEHNKLDILVHCAGRVGGIHANIRHPVEFLVQNLDMGRNILLGAKEAGIRQLINLGSSCMYPRNRNSALTEDQILTGELEPTNEGYALAKIATMQLGRYISREFPEFQYKTLIPCNLYGRYDKFDPQQSHLIPAIIHKLHLAKIKGEKTVSIWGDGFARREFMYAGDLADAVLQAIHNYDATPEIMNIGLGFDYSINDYYQIAAEVIGFQGSFLHETDKPVGMARKLINIDQQKKWGWRPVTNLRTGILNTYKFYLTEYTK